MIWGLLFRLLPSPTPTGLRRVGNPDRSSPVLVTCNFDLTVKRVTRVLDRAGLDAWLLVAQSQGVNVCCAAGADEFDTNSVVTAVKTSGIDDLVDHRKLVLPPLGAPAIRAVEVRERTGWVPHWGPVYAEDLPRYLADRYRRDEAMKRVTYAWRERLDTGLGSMFAFYLFGALGFLIFGRSLLFEYLWVGAAAFLFFFLACPWLPGKTGVAKVLVVDAVLAVVLVATELMAPGASPWRAELVLGMVLLMMFGGELGGLSSTLRSDFDPFLARLGIGAIGNTAFAGTVRTELLNGYRVLTLHRERCKGCGSCTEVCPQGVWEMGADKRSVLAHIDDCTACRACITQCPEGAIEARTSREL
ncbi:MAG: 4Fe-4S binding protein [Deltaproteobacteria bacterium]|nr:4Fe-4S binding protein [Deltaproteobacteria bacterium]